MNTDLMPYQTRAKNLADKKMAEAIKAIRDAHGQLQIYGLTSEEAWETVAARSIPCGIFWTKVCERNQK